MKSDVERIRESKMSLTKTFCFFPRTFFFVIVLGGGNKTSLFVTQLQMVKEFKKRLMPEPLKIWKWQEENISHKSKPDLFA